MTKTLLFAISTCFIMSCSKDNGPTEPEIPPDLLPLRSGNTWTYQFSNFDSGGVVIDTSLYTTTLDHSYFLDSTEWFNFAFLFPSAAWGRRSDGYYMHDPRLPSPRLIFRYPASIGDKWTFSTPMFPDFSCTLVRTDSLVMFASSSLKCMVYRLSSETNGSLIICSLALNVGVVRADFCFIDGRRYAEQVLVGFTKAQ